MLMIKLILLIILIPNLAFAESMNMIGEKGDPSEIDRIIEVKMYDNYYEPKEIKIKKNETIKFIVYNVGELVHEFNIATKKMHLKHQAEMMKMVEREILFSDKIDKEKMKVMAKKDSSMAHSHSNSVLLEPNKKADLIWKFNTDANLEAACNVPGHYEAGMISKINKT
tara:strand:+ start:521 stop:1024 length:504 start_codon:yes stop_codon:yes gene_type:complete